MTSEAPPDIAGLSAAAARAPILCAVTDRLRFGAGAGAASLDLVLSQIQEAADADLDLVQIREPDLPAARLVELVERAVRIVSGSRTRVLVNDRLDVALAAGAHGLHLRGVSFDAARVRAAVPPAFLVGRSVHGAEEAAVAEAAGGLDYLILGTMFPTASKPAAHALAGPEVLRAAARVCRLPLLAIGGVTLERVPEIARAGAAGLAAIGLFLGSRAPGATAGEYLRTLVPRIRDAFTLTG